MDERRIWVGCLNCCNSGRLTGEWFDLDGTDESDVNLATVHRHGKLTPLCEELWVMDFEGFDGLLNSEGSVSTFFEAGEVLAEIESLRNDYQDVPLDVIIERLHDAQGYDWAKWTLTDDAVNPSAVYNDWEDYAREFADDLLNLDELPDFLVIDWHRTGEYLRAGEWAYVERFGRLYIWSE